MNGATQVDADGLPPVIHRARMMVREASGRASVNLGGIAEASAFVPWGTKAFFVFQEKAVGNGPSIDRPNQIKGPRAPYGGIDHEKD